jgi:hypothetical protein
MMPARISSAGRQPKKSATTSAKADASHADVR